MQRLGKVDEDGVELALVLQRRRAEQDLVDVQVGVQIELDARVVLQHLEANRVLAAEELLLRIDADVEVVGEQVVVGAIAPVLAAQDVRARRRRWLRSRRLPGRRCGCRRRRLRRGSIVGAAVLAEQVLVEPADDVLQAFDAVPGTSRARELVALAREAHHDRRPLQVLQRAEQLLAAGRRRRAVVLVAEDEHQRRLDLRRRR